MVDKYDASNFYGEEAFFGTYLILNNFLEMINF